MLYEFVTTNFVLHSRISDFCLPVITLTLFRFPVEQGIHNEFSDGELSILSQENFSSYLQECNLDHGVLWTQRRSQQVLGGLMLLLCIFLKLNDG